MSIHDSNRFTRIKEQESPGLKYSQRTPIQYGLKGVHIKTHITMSQETGNKEKTLMYPERKKQVTHKRKEIKMTPSFQNVLGI